MSDIDKQLEHIYLNVNGKKAFIEATKALISTAVREARQQAIEDVKKAGYGYDDGSGFVLKISFAELAQLKEGAEE